MGAGSKIQIRGIPGVDDYEAFVTGHALWVRMVGAGGEDVNGTPQFLSGGTANGRPIELNNVAATTLHTVPAGSKDRVRLYISNIGDVDAIVLLNLGGNAEDTVVVFAPARETVAAIDEHMMGAGLLVQGQLQVGSTAIVVVYGDVERFSA